MNQITFGESEVFFALPLLADGFYGAPGLIKTVPVTEAFRSDELLRDMDLSECRRYIFECVASGALNPGEYHVWRNGELLATYDLSMHGPASEMHND